MSADGEDLQLPGTTAAELMPDGLEALLGGGEKTGRIVKVNQGKFGFIAQDDGEAEMFVLPGSCAAFGTAIPPPGTAVVYEVVVDQKTGRPRAENVRPAEGAGEVQQEVWSPAAMAQDPNIGEHERAGAVVRILPGATSGLILQDCGEDNVAFVPKACAAAFGGTIPTVGARVIFSVVLDEKTGKLQAEEVRPEKLGPGKKGGAARYQAEEYISPATGSSSGTGRFFKDQGSFGFIQQDSGEDKMFVMPSSCEAFGRVFPPLGTRVAYDIVVDGKTGRPRAENVTPETAFVPPSPQASWSSGSWNGHAAWPGYGARSSGTFVKDSGNFGFVAQDSGEDNMFVLPKSCQAFGGVLPPVGTRLVYDIVVDSKTGRPRAENVCPEESLTQDPFGSSYKQTGTVAKSGDTFGFIEQDSGAERMFVMPKSCVAWGNLIPPEGTRVMYDVVPDRKTGRPRADNVQPLDDEAVALGSPAVMGGTPPGWDAGVVADITNADRFGFIAPDGGGSNMFVMPRSCTGFEGVIPELGTRVIYRTVVDTKTGRPRAEDVQPEGTPVAPAPAPHKGAKGAKGAKVGGKGKCKAPLIAPAMLALPAWQDPSAQEEQGGSISSISAGFGFIKQDNGGDNMFVMPKACAAFANDIPPVGTRVLYTVVADAKTGRPRAEGVRPELAGELEQGASSWPVAASKGKGGYGPAGGKGKKDRGQPY